MKTLQWLVLVLLLLVPAKVLRADDLDVRHEIHFPDLPGYKTLVCDMHMHTVFSDGEVWPTVRVDEAWRQGLHALAITDHIEYQPHKENLPTNHNRPFELAADSARAHNLLLIKGAEITRETPPGHFNAVFVTDINPLDTKELFDVMKRAHDQGGFIFWNHQNWQGPEKGRWMDVHTTMYENKWLNGMEVANGESYYPAAHAWCLEKKLTMVGNSDIHSPDLRQKSTAGDHRTMTLVLAKQPTLAGMKEALLEGRTLVWYKDQLIGREEWLRPFCERCIRVAQPHLRTKSGLVVEVRNRSEADIRLVREGKTGPQQLTLPAQTTTLLSLHGVESDQPVELDYTVTNFLVAPGKGLRIKLTIPKQ